MDDNRAAATPSEKKQKTKRASKARHRPAFEEGHPSWFLSLALPSAMLSPTFRGSDGDSHGGKKQPSLDHGRLQAALFAAAAAAGDEASASANPPSIVPAARVTSDDDEEDRDSAPGATAAASKASSRRGRAPAVGAAE